jgi:predicted AlkP superfamily phosphohydrolase/phosphomutase
VIVIGLDCAPPALVFDRLAPRLPFLRAMVRRGASGRLRSIVPPITVPAWASMVSGKDAGQLGIYGFRDRIEGTRALRTVTSDDVRVDRVWDVLARHGLSSTALFVPPTFPVPASSRTANDVMVSCMLAPSNASIVSHPVDLPAWVQARGLDPRCLRADIDTEDERTPEKLLAALEAQVMRHFDLAEKLLLERPTDFFMMVEMATDRLHHGLWPALDPSDLRHERFRPHQRRAEDLYVLLDRRIARIAELVPDATLIVVSDHGARSIEGGIYVNEVLRRAGMLVLNEEPAPGTPLSHAAVDWRRTRAWGEGGYYARVFVNDRRFEGAPEIDRAQVTGELQAVLAAVTSMDGRPLATRLVRPETTFVEALGQPPDLLAFFGDLTYRSLGALGSASIYASPDEVDGGGGRGGCNHDWDGIVLATGPSIPRSQLQGAELLDIGPTLLASMGIEVPASWQGRALFG